MANQGYIIIKDGDKSKRATYRDFYGPLDKGSAKPSFCYPKKKENLKEEISKIKSVLDNGYVSKERVMEMKIKMKEKKERLDKINEQEKEAKKLFEENKDAWMKRREVIGEEIKENTPTKKDVRERRVSPHLVLRKEKTGLEDKKREYIVISRLAGEESNVSFLQKE
jgi:hypothetical protein